MKSKTYWGGRAKKHSFLYFISKIGQNHTITPFFRFCQNKTKIGTVT